MFYAVFIILSFKKPIKTGLICVSAVQMAALRAENMLLNVG